MAKNNRQYFSFDRETGIILFVVCCGIVATLSGVMFDSTLSLNSLSNDQGQDLPAKEEIQQTSDIVSVVEVPLATGDEPIDRLFIQSGCAVCHTIPGIEAAKGREGPELVLKTTGPQRLIDPQYSGTATTVREYILESILNPEAYVVPGYPDRIMPRWYGKKLNAQALEKITTYLENVTDSQ